MPVASRPRIPLTLVVVLSLVVAFAPEERTLGDGIRWVYLHVGLVWAGGLGLGMAGVLGLLALATERSDAAAWATIVERT